jgi:hypothetical protein
VIQAGEQFVILWCEGKTKPVANVEFSEVRDGLYEDLMERKYRVEMAKEFERLNAAAKIKNHLVPEEAAAEELTGAAPKGQPAASAGTGNGNAAGSARNNAAANPQGGAPRKK